MYFSTTIEQSGAAAGTFYYNIVFTNTTFSFGAGHEVHLSGYPVVYLLDAAGQVKATAVQNAVDKITQVTIGQTQKAYALLGIADAGDFGNSPSVSCVWALVTVAGHDPAVAKFPAPVKVAAVAPPTVSAVSATAV